MKDYLIVAFDNSTRRFINHYVDSSSKEEAIRYFNNYYEDCIVVNIIEL